MEVWRAMKESVERGIDHEGALPGPLNLPRKGPIYYVKASGYKQSLQSRALVYAYALSVSEENASGGTIVTAPTCGSCGVLPAVLYHLAKGCVALEVNGEWCFLGDALYAMQKCGHNLYNAGVLKEEIAVLENVKAKHFMLSHRTPFETPKGIIMRWLGEIYDRRVKGEVYIEI
jgi:hypothetical protein